jgi:AmpD protein
MLTIVAALWFSILAQPRIVNKPLPARDRRDTTTNYIVIHNDSSPDPKTTFRWLRRKHNSYHYYISRTGTIYRLVDTKYEAGHAGLSYYDGHWRMNKISIGICLENRPPREYTEIQYQRLSWLVFQLHSRYPDSRQKPILGHSDVAWPRGRKGDPGEHFDWQKFHGYLEKLNDRRNQRRTSH